MHIAIPTSTFPLAPSLAAGEDFAPSLAKALRLLGHEVTVISPLYRTVDPNSLSLARRLTKLEVTGDDAVYKLEVYDGRTSSGLRLVYLGHPDLFGQVAHLEEGGDLTDIAVRALAFASGAAELLTNLEPAVSAVHGVGWLGGLCGASMKQSSEGLRFVFTPGGPSDEQDSLGRFPTQLTERFPVSSESKANAQLKDSGTEAGTVSITALATQSADATGDTGSPNTLIASLLAHDASMEEKHTSIDPGVDSGTWNPATDAVLETRFDPTDLSGKVLCKTALQRSLELPIQEELPMVAAFVNPAVAEAFLAHATEALRLEMQVVCVPLPEDAPTAEQTKELTGLRETFKDRFAMVDSSPDLVHRILGAADITLVPTDRAALAMKAQRYGALPIAGASEASTIVDCDPPLSSGSGFIYNPDIPEDLLATLRRAASARLSPAFSALQQRVMRIDQSWERVARRYEQLYR